MQFCFLWNGSPFHYRLCDMEAEWVKWWLPMKRHGRPERLRSGLSRSWMELGPGQILLARGKEMRWNVSSDA